MKTIFKTAEEFIAEGFNRDYPNFYKGTKKQPNALLRRHLVENLGGKEVEVVEVEDADRGQLRIEYGGHYYLISSWMLRDTIEFKKIKHPKVFLIRGKAAKYFGCNFHFPCAFEDLTRADAIKVARWILRITGK